MHAFWTWVTASSKQKSRRVQDAEACFTKAELDVIHKQFDDALKTQGESSPHVLQERAFLHFLCRWPLAAAPQQAVQAKPVQGKVAAQATAVPSAAAQQGSANGFLPLGRALFRTCSGYSSRGPGAANDASGPIAASPASSNAWAWGGDQEEGEDEEAVGVQGVSFEDVIAAKAACDRMGTSGGVAFAFEVCGRVPLPGATSDTRTTAASAASAAAPMPVPQPQACISPQRLSRCIAAACSLLTALGCLRGTLSSDAGPQAQTQQQPEAQRDSALYEDVQQQWVTAVTCGALWTAAGPAAAKPAPHLDLDGYARWARACPAIHTLLTHLLSAVGVERASALASPPAAPASAAAQAPAKQQPPEAPPAGQDQASTSKQQAARLLMPRCPDLIVTDASGSVAGPAPLPDLMLHPMPALFLSHCMPPEHRKEWRLLFNSRRDGKSFNTLMGRLAGAEGATLLLVREAGEAGHLVAGYAPEPWRKNGAFFGDHSTWVARLLPDFQVFTSTGANTNFQWCGQGFSQLVNGIGFGGAQGAHTAFGLLLDDTLDSGHSRPIATFGCPSLTHTQVFQVESVECWLVQPPEPEDVIDSGRGRASVLDKAGADRIIMDLAGRNVNHSAGLRRAEPIN